MLVAYLGTRNMGAHFKLNRTHRAAIADQIETLIALLDVMDGDPDFEPEDDRCMAGDDGCAPFLLQGKQYWGSTDEDRGVLKPAYGINQTEGPINYVELDQAHRARLMGLERGPTGGWRRPSPQTA